MQESAAEGEQQGVGIGSTYSRSSASYRSRVLGSYLHMRYQRRGRRDPCDLGQ